MFGTRVAKTPVETRAGSCNRLCYPAGEGFFRQPGSVRRRGNQMLSLRRVSVALAVTGGLVWMISGLATATVSQPTHPDVVASPDAPTDVTAGEAEPTELAARYHLRKRTKRFFNRAKGRRVAARYHLRSRSQQFFDRAKGTQVAARYHLRTRSQQFFDRAKGTQVAGRYHLRTRSARFFGRSTA